MQKLCALQDIPVDGACGVEIDEQSLIAVQWDGQFHVYLNRCPHLGVELNWMPDQFMDSDGALLMCATHGALFAPESGDCLAGPCQGQALSRIPSEIRDDALWADLSAAPSS